jgi:hypothetical protein
MSPMTVPNEALKYILFQRTACQRLKKTFPYRLLKKILPFSIYNQIVATEAKIDSERIKVSYEGEIRKEYLCIKDFLPETCSSILDIGCGVAGIDVFSLQTHPRHQVLNKKAQPKLRLNVLTCSTRRRSGEIKKILEVKNRIHARFTGHIRWI